MRRTSVVLLMFMEALLLPGISFARDLGVTVLPIHKGKFTSSVLYEHLKLEDDFASRGRVDFKAHLVGAQISYGVTDQIAVAVKGASIIDPEVEAQGSQWESRAGYLYGIDLFNDVFPVTEVRPGLQLSGGVSGFQVPLDRIQSASGTTLIDQKMSGIEYHGALLGIYRFAQFMPYAGVRGFGSNVTWRDNQPAAGGRATIKGHAHGNIALVVGLPFQISPEVRFQLEGVFLNETAVTAGITLAAF